MSTRPRIEIRVGALERRQTNLELQIEEVSEDITSSFRQIGDVFDQHGSHLTKITNRLDNMEIRFERIENDINTMKSDIASLKAAMATKDDITRIETRVVDALTQVLMLINEQRPPSQ